MTCKSFSLDLTEHCIKQRIKCWEWAFFISLKYIYYVRIEASSIWVNIGLWHAYQCIISVLSVYLLATAFKPFANEADIFSIFAWYKISAALLASGLPL